MQLDSRDGLNRLADYSPVYRNYLSQYPESALWLVNPVNSETNFRYSAFKNTWQSEFEEDKAKSIEFLPCIQKFRRQMSMRIAFREINRLSDIENSMQELTLLAEFCLQEVATKTMAQWEKRLGQPWDDTTDRPARYCILGLGKLGGGELNFCSDIDLIYFFDGDGCCRKGGNSTTTDNEYFFNRAFQSLTKTLQERSEFGFLYNIDLRLRPEGSTGPIARSLAGMENYYYSAGQTWERLALLRARPVAGDKGLGEEFFESINPFRYPRHPPEELLSEVAGVKIRTEKELVGITQLKNDIKSGYGGIREIEFFVQALQLLHAGKNPFLQVGRTLEAIERLARYDLLDKNDASFLIESYNFLRKVEHRLQMKEEKQTHTLPENDFDYEKLAKSLGFATKEDLQQKISPLRNKVREIYKSLLTENTIEIELQDWTVFLSGKGISPAISKELGRWFGDGKEEEAAIRLRTFALGGPHYAVTREQVQLLVNLALQFDEVLPQLARPLASLERVSKFAESYSARKFFFKTCAAHPRFFHSLCLLLDRSRFTTKLLCQHPEIMEEVLVVQNRKNKPIERLLEELADLPQGNEFPKWLWLYVKAEQVRLSISQLAGDLDSEELEANLTSLADAVLRYTLGIIDQGGKLTVIGLGKFGAREMIFGSDLDLIILSDESESQSSLVSIKRLLAILGYRNPQGTTYEIDLRLRPYGRDGSLITTLDSFRRYYQKSAQTWEKQLLTRSRFICGNEQLGREFVEFRNQLIYSTSPNDEEWNDILKMKNRIEKAKVPSDNPLRAFKKGPGGLLEIEFLCQMAQLKFGVAHPELRQANTREVLAQLTQRGLLKSNDSRKLSENYEFLRSIELHLRRDTNKAVDTIDKQSTAQATLAKWMGFGSPETFWNRHQTGMNENKKIAKNLRNEIITSN